METPDDFKSTVTIYLSDRAAPDETEENARQIVPELARHPHLFQDIREISARAGFEGAPFIKIDRGRGRDNAEARLSHDGKTRTLIIGQDLLRSQTPQEIKGVIGHEMGHLLLGHNDPLALLNIAEAAWNSAAVFIKSTAPEAIRHKVIYPFTRKVVIPFKFKVLYPFVHSSSFAFLDPVRDRIRPYIEKKPQEKARDKKPKDAIILEPFFRRWELQADKVGAILAGSTQGLISSFQKISVQKSPPSKLSERLRTRHPSFAKRIRRLESSRVERLVERADIAAISLTAKAPQGLLVAAKTALSIDQKLKNIFSGHKRSAPQHSPAARGPSLKI